MKKVGKYEAPAPRRKMSKSVIAMIMAIVLAMGAMIGGTLAYLTQQSDQFVNTFTYGDINIELNETQTPDGDSNKFTNSYKMLPGEPITKDPIITVKKDSEPCWLYVKLEKSENFDQFMTYEMADGWTQLPGYDDVYYKQLGATTADTTYQVIKNNTVNVKPEVTKAQLNDLEENTLPKLTVTAYAVQYSANQEALSSAENAWKQVPQEVATAAELKEALAKGETVTLAKDVTVEGKLLVDANATLDLNGKTLTAGGTVAATDGGSLTIKNGKLDLGTSDVRAQTGSTLTLDHVELTASGNNAVCLLKNDNTVVLKNCTINAAKNGIMAWDSNNDVLIDNCQISTTQFGLYQNGSSAPSSYKIKGSTITSTDYPGIFVSNSAGRDLQELTIENSTVTAGMTAVEVKHTNATITGSTLKTTFTGNFAKASSNGSCTKGYALAVTGNGENDKATGTVVVENSEFLGTNQTNLCFAVERAEGASVTINGTLFTDNNIYFTK